MQVIDYRTSKFVMVPQSLAKDKLFTHRDKIVYMTLCMYSDNTSKQAHQSAQTIAKVAGIGRNGVFKAFIALEMSGYIHQEKRTYGDGKQTTNTYYLLDKWC